VVLDLREQVAERVFFLPEPFRLIIDVASTREGSRLGSARIGKEITRVVLDAGHGGHDPGAIGASGLMEKDVALDVALRAAPLIARELGVSALLTRETDEFVPLDERVARANAFNADLFVSLHCNASPSADGHGVMTFVLDSSRDQVALQVAARENDASEAASTQLARAMSQVMDTTTSRASVGFARLLQRASVASLADDYPGVWDGGVRQAGFYVLAGAHMPAVLFEMSFISNPTEELRLESPGYRQRLADGVVNAIRAYKSGL
jgi:N-acetylmuramoyl-L-alanine amidase